MRDQQEASEARQKIIEELRALLGREVGPDDALHPWDSVNVVSTVAIIEDHTGRIVSGQALTNCTTVHDVLVLAEVA